MNPIEKAYRRSAFIRRDNPYGMVYFSAEDFPGLRAHPFSFPSSLGHELKGCFYCYAAPDPNRLIVFDHGLGNGHRAYMKELRCLAAAGYLVFAYDHTGCMESGGESTGGLAQSLRDLDDCLRTLKKEPALAGRKIAVMGHSWGGFSAMNIPALHKDITHVVAMSGFVSVSHMLEQRLPVFLKWAKKRLLGLERKVNCPYADFDARKSLASTSARVLLIASSDDATVSPSHHRLLQQALAGKENITFLLTENKGHNPTYTREAARRKKDFFEALEKQVRKKRLQTPEKQRAFMDSFDWHRMSDQDEEVWAQILAHLEKD